MRSSVITVITGVTGIVYKRLKNIWKNPGKLSIFSLTLYDINNKRFIGKNSVP
jgi:hypothetical protein